MELANLFMGLNLADFGGDLRGGWICDEWSYNWMEVYLDGFH